MKSSGFDGGLCYAVTQTKATEAQQVRHSANRDSNDYIDERVLFEKNGGKADKDSADGEEYAPTGGAETGNVPGSAPNCYRPNHMQGGANIGIGVKLIEGNHKTGKKIVSRQNIWTQILYSGPKKKYHQSNGIGDDHKADQAAICPEIKKTVYR